MIVVQILFVCSGAEWAMVHGTNGLGGLVDGATFGVNFQRSRLGL